TVGNYMSRKSERAADMFAMRLTGNADAFRSSMIKMGDLNLMEANPAAWSVAAGYTHPVTAERVALADSMAGRPPSDAALGAGQQEGRWFARVALSWGVPVVLGVGIAMWGVGTGLAGFSGASSIGVGVERGPSGAWHEHLALARAAAAEVDPEAVLYNVTARPYDVSQDWLRSDVVLDVTFNFVGSEGLFSVSTLDKNPPEVYYVGDVVPAADYRQIGVPLPDAERAASRAGYLRIKPRLALAASLPDGLRFAQIDKASIYPYLVLDLDTGEAEPAWVVGYTGTAQELKVRLDAVTGEILSREVEQITYDEWEGN
ncbi:MAG TPA: M48 family metalloprotease, partial [Chloroflexia bacterium]|nr:M48 family metalloprotease [Chloroflexia bacterium]